MKITTLAIASIAFAVATPALAHHSFAMFDSSKNITLTGPEASVVWLGPPMLAFCLGTKPLLLAMKWAARQVLRL